MVSLVDLLDNKYTLIKDDSLFLKKVKYYSLQRFLVKVCSNILIPLFYKCTSKNENYILNKNKRSIPVVVSLTSFPLRINGLWIVVESMLRDYRI